MSPGPARDDVLAQHRSLEALFDEAGRILRGSRAEAARKELAALREALETHFEQEDHLYYPPVATLRPELEADIRSIAAAHERFRAALADVEAQVALGAHDRAANTLAELAREFGRHERAEEALLAGLERSLPTAR